jgi:hypothetical protein
VDVEPTCSGLEAGSGVEIAGRAGAILLLPAATANASSRLVL